MRALAAASAYFASICIREAELRVLQFIAVAAVALVCGLAPARAQKRVALVIGNSSYQQVGRLPNAVNDAAAMAALFKSASFDVVEARSDLGIAAMRRAIGDFADEARDSDIAVIYFAGHGIEVDGVNYLIPVDAVLARDFDVEDETISLDRALRAIDTARRLRLVILDACRSNPFVARMKRSSRAIGRGLKAVEPDATNTLVAYAAKAGSTAADGDGDHSPFTAALLKHLATPGLDIRLALGAVRDTVIASTTPRQEPFVYGSLGGRTVAIVEGSAGVPAVAGLPPGGSALVSEAALVWETVKSSPDIGAVDAYLARYGNVPVYGDLARARRGDLARDARKEPSQKPPGDQVAMAVEPSRPGTVLTPAQERALKPKDVFRECADCPEMVVVPAGTFTMGSPAGEKGRFGDEGPQHDVTIGRAFAVGRFHVTRDQFASFVRDTGYEASTRCWTLEGGKFEERAGRSWRSPGFTQEGSHPVVCVSWDDAKAYVDWVARKTGKPYRLLSEAEWEYAARGRTSPGSYPRFWFGNDESDLCRNGNGADQKARDRIEGAKTWTVAPCNDGYAYTSPVGHYTPNAFGLYDMAGNAWQWTADCWHGNYNGAPADGSVWATTCNDASRAARGGSWNIGPRGLRASVRSGNSVGYNYIGFRLARTFTP
jgi:formylglycine-generating enzyme required for sulfatase activity